MNPPPATVEQLVIRLEEAARVLRLVALTRGSRPPKGAGSGWPDYRRDAVEAYGWQTASAGKIQPSAAEIAAMDEVLRWMAQYWSPAALHAARLPRDAGQVAWQRLTRVPIPKIATQRWERYGLQRSLKGGPRPPGGVSRVSIMRLSDLAIRHLARSLGIGVPGALPEPDPPRVVMGVVVEFVTEETVRVDGQGRPSYRTTHARARHDLVKPGRGQG
jgi:hypothetical protein